MRLPLDLVPMALCGLATIVAVAVILVASDLLRRFVLTVIARVESGRRARTIAVPAVVTEPSPEQKKSPQEEDVSQSETIPG